MPNWTRNKFMITGEEEKVREVYDFFGRELSFEKIVPVPERLNVTSPGFGEGMFYYMQTGDESLKEAYEECIAEYGPDSSKARYERAKEEYESLPEGPESSDLSYLWTPGNDFASRNPRNRADFLAYGRIRLQNISDYGAEDWYDYCCNEWGCKWDAWNTGFSYEEGSLVYKFKTPWAPPWAFLEKHFMKKFPEVKALLEFVGEDVYGDAQGYIRCKNGKYTEKIYEDEKAVRWWCSHNGITVKEFREWQLG